MRVFHDPAAQQRLRLKTGHEILPNAITSGEFARSDTIKIVAVGFGQPDIPGNLSNEPRWIHDYWQHAPEPATEEMRIGVVGPGDGGLTEAIEHSLWHEKDNRWITQRDLRELLEALDDEAQKSDKKAKEMRELAEVVVALDSDPDHRKLACHGKKAFEQALKQCGFRLRNKDKPVLVFLPTDRPNGSSYINQKPFRLNRWLIAQLEQQEVLRLVPYPKPSLNKIRLNGVNEKKYIVPTWTGCEELDRLFVRIGPKPVPGWETFIDDFKSGAKEYAETTKETSGEWKGHIVYKIARRPPPQAESGTRYFYSDLYDSPAQRAVLDALRHERQTLRDAENELVRLYERRLLLEVARRDCVLLSDNQVFDGTFFLRWLPRLSEVELECLLTAVRVGTFRVDPLQQTNAAEAIFDAIVSKGGKSREFEFSAVVHKPHRDEITEALRAQASPWRGSSICCGSCGRVVFRAGLKPHGRSLQVCTGGS